MEYLPFLDFPQRNYQDPSSYQLFMHLKVKVPLTLIPIFSATERLVKSVFRGENGHEEVEVYVAGDGGLASANCGYPKL
jgi:hypothetical protein